MHVVMKSLNEAKSVRRCIGDFHDETWVDQIVVVDCYSSDFTVHELKQFPKVVVHQHEYRPDYHDAEIIAANIMHSYVPIGDIFLMLDFDERLNDPLKAFLADVNNKNELPEGADLVHIARRTIDIIRYEDSPFAMLGPDGWPYVKCQIGSWPDYQPRLFRRSCEIHWVQSPHRTAIGFKKNFNLNTDCFLLHYEKDDYRDREWIERRWLRPNAARKILGLPCDLYETGAKPEYAEAADPAYWRDK